jgi:predicted O-methyltransferase YrrM
VKTVDELVAFSAQVEGQGVEDHQNCTYTTAELRAIATWLVQIPQASNVVEIGVYGGRSTSLFFQLQRDLALDIHLVDNWSWDVERAMRTFVKLVTEHFSEIPFTLHKTLSANLGQCWKLPIHFLHIDGWHDLNGIEPDCKFWLPHVVSGGIVAFHDSDCPPVADCIKKYCDGFIPLELAFRTTVWRKLG